MWNESSSAWVDDDECTHGHRLWHKGSEDGNSIWQSYMQQLGSERPYQGIDGLEREVKGCGKKTREPRR